MLEQYQLAPKDEDEMEDFRDFDDEHSDLGSKLDEFADDHRCAGSDSGATVGNLRGVGLSDFDLIAVEA